MTTVTIGYIDLTASLTGDTALTGSLTIAGADVGNQAVTIGTLQVVDGNNGGNYNLTIVSETVSITKKALILTVTNATKVYDGTNTLTKAHLGSNYSLAGKIGSDDVDLDTVTGTFAQSAAGATAATITAAALKDTKAGNYMLSATLPANIPATITSGGGNDNDGGNGGGSDGSSGGGSTITSQPSHSFNGGVSTYKKGSGTPFVHITQKDFSRVSSVKVDGSTLTKGVPLLVSFTSKSIMARDL